MSQLIQCSALLFDMDGVLVDSMPSVARIYTQWALEHGFNPEEVVRVARGRPCIATIRDYLPDSDHEVEKQKIEDREMEDLDDLTVWPGACDLLQSLPLDRWAIVTSCTRGLAEARLVAAGLPRPLWFVTCSDVVHGKPHPEPYEKGANLLGFDPRECVVVEDAPAGIRSGKAAGARVLALRTTAPEADLWQAGADWVVENCAALKLTEKVHRLQFEVGSEDTVRPRSDLSFGAQRRTCCFPARARESRFFAALRMTISW